MARANLPRGKAGRPLRALPALLLTVALACSTLITGCTSSPAVNAYEGKVTLADRALPQRPELYGSDSYVAGALGLAPKAERPQTTPAAEPTAPTKTPTAAELLALPNQPGIFTFCLSDPTAAPKLTPSQQAAVAQATAPLDEQGLTVGYLFVDLSTGAGVASNIDARYYCASTIKAPFSLFICQTIVDGSLIELSDTLEVGFAAPLIEYGVDSLELRQLIEAAIRESDNDAYRILRANFEQSGWTQWLDGLGLAGERFMPHWYVDVSVRDMALLWLATYNYLEAATPTALWLQDLLAHTERSYIRTGLSDEAVTVENKAGWITDEPSSAINDCGLVRTAAATYLLCILSNAPEGDATEGAIGTLADALYETRGAFPTQAASTAASVATYATAR